MSQKHKLHKTAAALSMISQFGLSVATPIVLCILAAGWLKQRFALGDWVMLAGVLTGVGSGLCSILNFIKRIQKKIDEEKEEKE